MAVKNKSIALALIISITVLNIPIDVFGIQPQKQVSSQVSRNSQFPVLFESPRVLVVRKPHGISHHDESLFSRPMVVGEGDGDSITSGVLRLLRNERQQQSEENGERLYGVHRLDKVTSGILVLAKDAATASILSDYFARGKIQKVYFGLSAKKPQKKKQGLVQGGMARSRNKSWKLVRKPKNDRKSKTENFAKTRFFTAGFKIIDGDMENSKDSSLDAVTIIKTVAMFRPYTGKTHQLRVAAKAMGIPLLGDPIYKDGSGCKSNNSDDLLPAATRTMLHASGIHIPEFLDQAEINVWCPPTFFHDGENGGFVDITEGKDDDEIMKRSARRELLSDSLALIVEKLMTKNCDVSGILETMLTHQHQQQK